MIQEFDLELENYSGPYDLLLDLVRKNKMDIEDIDLIAISNQYIDLLNKLSKEENKVLNYSEYLIIAIELLELKTKSMLNKFDDQKEVEEAKKDFVQRLIEYKRIKDAVPQLNSLHDEASRKWTKNKANVKFLRDNQEEYPFLNYLDPNLLYNSIVKIADHINYFQPVENIITSKVFSPHELKGGFIRTIKEHNSNITLKELLTKFNKNLSMLTSIFIVMLELIFRQELLILKGKKWDQIELNYIGE